MNSNISGISARAFDTEDEVVATLLTQVETLRKHDAAILLRAKGWVETIRAGQAAPGMESFLQAYGLDTREGVALMCLAEALLRIPDADTADRLIHDTFEGKNWRAAIKGDEPWLVGASSWGLLLTGKMVELGEMQGIAGLLPKLMTRLGEPLIRQALKQAMRLIGSQFVLGETIEQGMANAVPWEKKGYRFSYDILGEGARSDKQAQTYMAAYRHAIIEIGKKVSGLPLYKAPGLSVKLSALHPRYSLSQEKRVMQELMPRITELALLAREHNLTISIDAEEANRFDIELLLFTELMKHPGLAGWNGLGFVLQAYQKRAVHALDYLCELARKHGRIIPLRLVKGAYWDSEIKHAQVQGLPKYPVFTHKAHTDVSYLACAEKILGSMDCFYPQFATHNARTIASIQLMAKEHAVSAEAYEFQRLHGMGEVLHDQIIGDHASRIYAPIGPHKDLLAYLIRRLLENGANTSFVHLLMDDAVSAEQLLADPIALSASVLPRVIPLPDAIYGDRRNSRGYDLGYLCLRQKLSSLPSVAACAAPPPCEVERAILSALRAFPAWSALPHEKHCHIIETVADKLEEDLPALVALLVEEAGKTLPDAISEVREAADMCRYYAMQSRQLRAAKELAGPTGESNQFTLHPRGVFACISPWNFPLAIFTGQVVAALATGNCVIAKPAEQTPRIAARAVSLMHAAGVPQEALQLAVGKGSVVGAALTSSEHMAGIVFTGSVEVAHMINRTLANRQGPIIPFIAETGGQNCMVVDSSALLEQVVDDVMVSAFGSAGQRCSALRVLYLQQDIADDFLTLLSGAMQELSVGDPALFSTDVGPVIDAGAQKELRSHIEQMKRNAHLIASAPSNATQGHFVAPHAFEIHSIGELTKENFGPILHVVRFDAAKREQVAEEINSTGYGLTFGIHSRVEENIHFFLTRVRAGNYYVNRSMIGAVVGVQPFGGEGLSGTGPKAGGPYYLLRFMHERTTTINSAAIGGNIALLSGKRD